MMADPPRQSASTGSLHLYELVIEGESTAPPAARAARTPDTTRHEPRRQYRYTPASPAPTTRLHHQELPAVSCSRRSTSRCAAADNPAILLTRLPGSETAAPPVRPAADNRTPTPPQARRLTSRTRPHAQS